jgi:hypothetical protein
MTRLKLDEVIHASGGAILDGPTVGELLMRNREVVREWARLSAAEIRKRSERARASKTLADNCK